MSTISNGSVDLHVEDTGGDGRPVVLIHGWPLSGASWAATVPALTAAGHRVITYDRRGFGGSSKPGEGSSYDYDTLTGDLDAVLTELDLRDVTLVGFSMGGGEVARYLGTRGEERVRSAVFAAAIPPNLKQDDAHPDGALDDATVEGMQRDLAADPTGFLDGFLTNFYSADGELKVTEEQRQAALGLAAQADVHAAVQCIRSWVEDFSGDLAKVTVPVARRPRRHRRDRAAREVGTAHGRAGPRRAAARPHRRAARHQRLAHRGVQPRARGFLAR